MKSFILIITSCILASVPAMANGIDRLQTLQDVQNFLHANTNQTWHLIPILDTTIIATTTADSATMPLPKFFKIDINDDTRTDLVVIQYGSMYALIDKGNEHYESHWLNESVLDLGHFQLLNITNGKPPLFIISHRGYYSSTSEMIERIDTLIFKFNEFIEYNSKPVEMSVQEIEFSCIGGLGGYRFKLIIKQDTNSAKCTISYSDEKADCKAAFDRSLFNDAVAFANYLNVESLSSNYFASEEDAPTIWLAITFSNGKIKKIRDTGAHATLGLARWYAEFTSLRNLFPHK